MLDVFSKSTVDKGNILEVVKPEDIPFERERSGNLGIGETDPTLDKEGIISGNLPGSFGTKYISNAQYFLENPRHGDNSTGTCGAVAAQLLLSYHNYYSDRRIIAPQHLNGVWDNATSNGNVFDPANYTTLIMTQMYVPIHSA